MFTFGLSACASECPERIQGTITISNWQFDSPKEVSMIQYKKNSNFKNVEYNYPQNNIYFKGPTIWEGKSYLVINIGEPVGIWLSTNSDYKLIVDNKVQYRLTDFVSSNRKPLGCPLKSFKVNNKILSGGKVGLDFEQNEGEPVKQ